MVYTKIIDDASPADRPEVRRGLDALLARSTKPPKGSAANGKGRRRGPGTMTPAQAAKIAADMADWDAKAAKGKVGG